MYKISPVLTEYEIDDPGLMYKMKPIQKIGSNSPKIDMAKVEAEQDLLFEQLDALSNRVNTVLSVLSKNAPKRTHGLKFVEKCAPIDIVVNVNPQQSQPKGG